MTNKKISNSVKRRLLIFGTLSILVIVYTFINFLGYVLRYTSLKNEQENLSAELITLKEKEEDLTIELTKLKDPEYIARYARENYLYSRDGEYIIRIEKKDKEEKEDEQQKNYLPYYIGLPIIVLVIYKIKKK